MRQFQRSMTHDSRYRKRVALFDKIPEVDIAKSIKEMRSIYNDMDDYAFAKWYEKRYRIKTGAVLAVLAMGDTSL